MPLHTSSLISRHDLTRSSEEPLQSVFERVLKYNPHHDPATGRFAPSGGGRQGGTAGPPTHNYAGQKLTGVRSAQQTAAVVAAFHKPSYYTSPPGNPAQNLPFHPGAPVKGYTPAVNPAQNFAAGTRGAFNINDTKTHPVGTIYESNKVIVPTTETVDAATRHRLREIKSHPIGTSYSRTGTMIPHGEGYFHLESGKVYRTHRY